VKTFKIKYEALKQTEKTRLYLVTFYSVWEHINNITGLYRCAWIYLVSSVDMSGNIVIV